MIEKYVRKTLVALGEFAALLMDTLQSSFKPTFSVKLLVEQIIKMGVGSFWVGFITTLFTGMVMALQIAVVLDSVMMGISQYVGSMVGKAMVKELAPMLLALVFAGRVGSAITAEIGTMKVSEQLDALKTLYTNSTEYVVVPRFWAGVISLPLLTITADVVGVVGGAIVVKSVLDADPAYYMFRAVEVISLKDFFGSLIKATVFGAEIMLISCFFGLRTSGGAEGVGRSTTRSVVVSFIAVLISDYVLVMILTLFGW